MWTTCVNVIHMSKMVQVRHVPDEVHRALKVRAARAGMSLSDYLRVELERLVERAAVDDLLDAADADASVAPDAFAAAWADVVAERPQR
jgi:plasmid stability protein